MEVKCKRCDGVYRLRSGKFGVFAGCSNFPQCRSTMKLPAFFPPKRFVVFDVETPNSANDRMSAIGVTVVEGGAIVEEFASLVNPETHFDPFNIRLTGITPEAAAQAPAFPALWPTHPLIWRYWRSVWGGMAFNGEAVLPMPALFVWGGTVIRICPTISSTPSAPIWASSWTTIRPAATATPAPCSCWIIWNVASMCAGFGGCMIWAVFALKGRFLCFSNVSPCPSGPRRAPPWTRRLLKKVDENFIPSLYGKARTFDRPGLLVSSSLIGILLGTGPAL